MKQFCRWTGNEKHLLFCLSLSAAHNFCGARGEASHVDIASSRPWLYEEKYQKLILKAHSKASWMYAAANVEKISAWIEPDVVTGCQRLSMPACSSGFWTMFSTYLDFLYFPNSFPACEETQARDRQGNHEGNQEAKHLSLRWQGRNSARCFTLKVCPQTSCNMQNPRTQRLGK